MKKVYLDYSATTPLREEVRLYLKELYSSFYSNPSNSYSLSSKSKEGINKARKIIASIINCSKDEIIFTSGGTESDNLALMGTALSFDNHKKHIIVSSVEHHAILKTCSFLEKIGFNVSYLAVDKQGKINLKELEGLIHKDTFLLSIMHVNNEIGTIFPIKEIGKIAKKHDIIFHVDAVQSFSKLPIDVLEFNIDLLSASSHKFYGPKGVGFLYKSKKVKIKPVLYGGQQENGLRPGTENVEAIMAMAHAAHLGHHEMDVEQARMKLLSNYLIDLLNQNIKNFKINGDLKDRYLGNLNISFPDIDGESLLLMLDLKGIYLSTGSACNAGSEDASHVLKALDKTENEINGSIRISLGRYTTKEDLVYFVEELRDIVKKLRKVSPLSI